MAAKKKPGRPRKSPVGARAGNLKKTPPKVAQSMRDVAEEEGFSPGRFYVRRLVAIVDKLEKWGSDIERGLVPDDLLHLRLEEARELYLMEAGEAMRMDVANLDYFFPKMRSADAKLEVDGELVINVLRFTDDDNAAE